MAKALDFGQGLIFVSLLKKKYTELSRDSRFDSWRDRVFNLFCSLCCRFCSLFFFFGRCRRYDTCAAEGASSFFCRLFVPSVFKGVRAYVLVIRGLLCRAVMQDLSRLLGGLCA